MTRRLYLVRHTAVEAVEGVPAHEWLPTTAGLEAARRLAGLPIWRDVDVVATSTEPKARATAQPIAAAAGVSLREEPDLREVVREPAPLDAAGHRDRVRRYLGGEPISDWEPRASALGRFERSVETLLAATTGSVAVVSHGTVLALFLGLTPDEWAAIPLPAVAVVDSRTKAILRPFAGLADLVREAAVSSEPRG